MKHIVSRIVVLSMLLTLVVGALPAAAQEPVTIKWFIGLGTGSQPDQLEAQQAVVDAFNASQSEIVLETIVVTNTGTAAVDALSTLISSGDVPDIVGPVGVEGSNAFAGQFLDLTSLVESTNYDLSEFDEASIEFYRENGELLGLPFASSPSFIYFDRDLFDEAGLAYPPQEWGAPYVDADGNERPWDIDTLTELALQLTVDANGNDATSEDFDKSQVEQWGWFQQWTEARGHASFFGAGTFLGEDNTAVVPEHWRDFYHWYYSGIWETGFIPSNAQEQSDMLNAGNAFQSGRLAMDLVHLWYNASAGEGNWDIAALPSYNGVITSKLHADTFRIMKDTQHPEEAFTVLSYLLDEGAGDLLQVYGSFPARESLQEGFLAQLEESYPGVNWQVAVDALAYPDIPNHQSNLPNFVQATDRIQAFTSLYQGTEGLDIDAELESLRADLEAIFQSAQ